MRDERLAAAEVTLHLHHDDNKARKLKYNLAEARASGRTTLLTFGGAYSNHLLATARAGAREGFTTVGIVRGEEHLPLNPVLAAARDHGMRLAYLDRGTYRRKHTPEVIDGLRERYGDFHLLPEGGSNAAAARGCAELPAEIGQPFDLIACAVGTGGTLAGIAAGLRPDQRALGFAVLKGAAFLNEDVAALQREAFGRPTGNWSIDLAHHYGGYAKRTPKLDAFIEDFRERHGETLNWVYEAKMLAGLYDLTARATFPRGTRIVAVLA
ncbi:1-aminocyclopropane-1-carboxylate deaminase/D-cysteine desulfhydrase [Wenjunlia tyrosinilytica]|jgi:1-aminocyclopropane-1-carboxylate deaminase|uniref:1-aminocyclopropane-1-carboxylate deaminase n=1 Tax=Wenjunlia tyrosinilytica TaxID=1544741 RepID=A0A917ZGF3_9ACTN|nr:pyridoxal-phosphate dependent enzyme [Wenjunlia tyrosinilytica]GGO81564.1 1-aminocyclopropane-1-carboxylate deaminase [Wenjunlia tyrosinilytica]